MNDTGQVYIPSVDAKDLYLANHLKEPNPKGYSLLKKDGTPNYKKFINTLDFSLDLIHLREVDYKLNRNLHFSFTEKGKEFSSKVINVTFKYSVKEFNLVGKITTDQKKKKKSQNKKKKKDKKENEPKLYVKAGYSVDESQLEYGAYVVDGELIAIAINMDIPEEQALSKDILQKNFVYENGQYVLKKNATLVSVGTLRNELYKHGFQCAGNHYVRFKRSAGSSRVGKCLFIDGQLYPAMHRYEMLGLKVRHGQVIDLAALEAYIALTLSSIIDTIQIDPKSILVVDDYKSLFKDRVIATRIENDAFVTKEDEVEIENSIWDGESLIDVSAMGKYSVYGMVLIRKQFFKSCCFNTNIQKFFDDNGITDISQLNGFTLAENVSDIKLITTPSSIKFVKFGTIREWLERIDSTFGVVKHEKKTHFFEGRMVQTHYQLINTLQMSKSEVREFLKPTLDYMDKLKLDPAVLRYHIHYPDTYRLSDAPLKSKNDIVFKLMGLNEDFTMTQWFHDFRKKNIDAFKNNLRYGHVLVEGNYSTLLGNPYEMLLQSIGKFDGTSIIDVGTVHSTRFEYGKELLGSRSPHVCTGNVLLCKNVENEVIDRYFNLTNEIVCINSINENILQRLSGADFDSDTLMLTDNSLLIQAAKKNYDKFLVPTNLVEATKSKRYYTAEQQADLDIKTSVNKIGEIINLSQELQSYMWDQLNNGADFEDVRELYYDICQLDVMSGCEIDKAKKEFSVKNEDELEKLRIKWIRRDEAGRAIKPYFFGHVAQTKGYFNEEKKNYLHHDTAMDYLEELLDEYRSPTIRGDKIPMSSIFVPPEEDNPRANYGQISRMLEAIRKFKTASKQIWTDESVDTEPSARYQSYNQERNSLIEFINKEVKPNINTIYRMLKQLEKKENADIKGSIIDIMFSIGNETAFELLKKSQSSVELLVPCPNGGIELFGLKFAKTCNN